MTTPKTLPPPIHDRARIIEQAHRAVSIDPLRLTVFSDASKSCLLYAFHLIMILRSEGHDAQLQGGTLIWQAVPDELDDGKQPTHFSYMFEEGPARQRLMSGAGLPEMHVWVLLKVGDPDAMGDRAFHVIDPMTRFLKGNALTSAPSLKWLAPDPPDFVWGNPAEVMGSYPAIYAANKLACRMCYAILNGLGRLDEQVDETTRRSRRYENRDG